MRSRRRRIDRDGDVLLTTRCQEGPITMTAPHHFFPEPRIMTTQRNAIDWFEIPVRDMNRAIGFYEELLATPIRRETIANHALGVFAYDEAGVGGCLIAGDDVPAPALNGTLI